MFEPVDKDKPELYQELVESIIDLVAELPTTLTQCSLISRAWRPRSQYWLFRTLDLFFEADRSGCSQARNRQGEKFLGYIHRLQSTALSNEVIVTAVRHLSVEFKPKASAASIKFFGAIEEMPVVLPFTRLESFEITHRLQLSNHKQLGRRMALLCSFLIKNTSIRRLLIDSVDLNPSTSQKLVDAISCLPCLEELCLDRVSDLVTLSSRDEQWHDSADAVTTELPLKRMSCLKSQSVASTIHHTPGGRDFFLNIISLPLLEELVVEYRSRQIIRKYAHSLKRVTLFMPMFASWNSHFTNDNSDAWLDMTQLTHVHLIFPQSFNYDLLRSQSPFFTNLIFLPKLQSLFLVLPGSFTRASWEAPALDGLLSSIAASSASDSLEEIGIWNPVGSVRLPLTNQTGLLKLNNARPLDWWMRKRYRAAMDAPDAESEALPNLVH